MATQSFDPQNPPRVVETFLDLVAIESPSYHEAAMAAHCADALRDLGFEVVFDDSQAQTGSDTGNLIARLPGETDQTIVLSAHMDTVEPCQNIEPVFVEEATDDGTQWVIRSKGETILSADDKAGIAMIFEAIRRVLEAGLRRPTIIVVLTVCEEQSLAGSSAIDISLVGQGYPTFVLDANGAPGTLIMQAPYHYSYKATFKGKAAHGGVNPEDGASAILMAAQAITQMPQGRLDDQTTANVGIINGGIATNIVADHCVVEGECRSITQEKVENVKAAITEALEKGASAAGGDVEVQWTLDYPGVDYQKDDPLVQTLTQAADSIGLAVEYGASGGGADSNVFNHKGLKAITLGIGMRDFHGVNESIAVEDLETMSDYVEALIKTVAEQ